MYLNIMQTYNFEVSQELHEQILFKLILNMH